ncbi:hypothetical protein D3C72_301040 [compost metagenome]
MNILKVGVISMQLLLVSCASTGGESADSSETDDGTVAMLGAVVSGLLGGLYGAETGDIVQAQNITNQSMAIFTAMNPQDGSTDDQSSDIGDETNNSAGTISPVDISNFKPEEYMASSGNCEKNLAYLSNRLYQYPMPLVSEARSAILDSKNSDMHTEMIKFNQMNTTPDAAIQKLLQQAQEHDRVFHEAIQTAVQTDSSGTTAEQFEKEIKSGTLSINECDGIRSSALCAAIVNNYGYIAYRAAAANFMCYKRTNQWPTEM